MQIYRYPRSWTGRSSRSSAICACALFSHERLLIGHVRANQAALRASRATSLMNVASGSMTVGAFSRQKLAQLFQSNCSSKLANTSTSTAWIKFMPQNRDNSSCESIVRCKRSARSVGFT